MRVAGQKEVETGERESPRSPPGLPRAYLTQQTGPRRRARGAGVMEPHVGATSSAADAEKTLCFCRFIKVPGSGRNSALAVDLVKELVN